jgi:glycosyltransferase involved in cell wall biosynthesis
MKRIVIVMPYFDRQYQLDKTLATIIKSHHRDITVVLVDDGSITKPVLRDDYPFFVYVVRPENKTWTNCSPVWNYGFNEALQFKPDIIILQSAECYWVGDLAMYAEEHLTDDNYIAFGCFQIDKETTFKEHDIVELSKACNYKVSTGNKGLGQNAWWNHPVYDRLPQYWGCAITAKNLIALNGIDERFADGYAIEDGYFVWQVEKLGLRIDITDYPFVVHQWHDRVYPPNVPALVKKNKELYEELIKLDSYRSKHTITPDLHGLESE